MIAILVAVAGASVAEAQTAASGDRRERERRAESSFVAGRYQEAIEVLNSLYADFHNPLYLRNLGRCHQRLKDPDRAIAAFDEYLRRAKNVTSEEREEVRGFIREMEELKKQREATAAPPPPPPPAHGSVTAPAPASTPAAVAPPPMTSATPAPAAATASPPPTVETTAPPARGGKGKWIGIGLLGAAAALAVGGGAMLASSWSEYRRGTRQGCETFACPNIADRVEARSLWAKILFGGAVAAGIAGGTVLVLSLSKESSTASTGMTLSWQGRF
jgi:tetratricopeptide (TPR) repeat protein